MRFLLSVLLLWFYTSGVLAKADAQPDCKKHGMYCQILKWRPNIDKKWAMKFSDLLFRYGKKYDMDPWRSLAIAMQESSLRNIHRKHTIIVFHTTCVKGKCHKTYHLVRGYSDLSIFQFHINTALAYDMDILRLDSDLDYAVSQHFKLLKLKEARCEELGSVAWSCYHSVTPTKRHLYAKLVNRYYIAKDDRGYAVKLANNTAPKTAK